MHGTKIDVVRVWAQEEAENERMHLLTFLQLSQPGYFMRGLVLLTQVRH